jgi:hypothetical protein
MPVIEILVRGHLDHNWSDRLGGLCINHCADGTTMLLGTVRDQSALHGLLNVLGNLNLELLSVTTEGAKREKQDGGGLP